MNKMKFETLINRFSRRIFNYLLKILKNREDAEDVLQEVFVAFYKKMDSVKDESYLLYLYQTAYHKALNKISARKRSKKFSEKLIIESSCQQSDNESNENDQNDMVVDAFNKLKPKEAFLLELQFYQKLSYREIAEIMATSISAIDSKLVRAKKKLKKILAQEMKSKKVIKYRGDNYEQEVRL